MLNTAGNRNSMNNRGGLLKEEFIRLPLGATAAAGWLKRQMILQKNGLTGAMEDYPDYGPDSGWLGGDGESWERGPYYVRGLVALAYALQDEELIQRARKWIDWSIGNQREDGYFGPASDASWWPRMPMLMAVRDYYEATELVGKPDGRVIPFMENYFRYEEANLPANPLTNWADARGGDNIETIYWLYNRLYDAENPGAVQWLLDLAALIRSQTKDWTAIFSDTTVREHVVNTTQALKMPPLYYRQSKDAKDREAFEKGLFNWSIDHGRFDGLANSDEAARDNKPTRGSELCGIVEGMLSTEIAVGVLGESRLGDRLEKLAYNSLPAAYAPDYLGHVYYIPQNQVLATGGYHEFDCDHGDSSAFGAPCGFDCCFANNHMGWPKFVQTMWMATQDNGLAVIAYGPNTVSALVEQGRRAAFTQTTDYPFDEEITLLYGGEIAAFPLMLRIPVWCANPVITVNGTAQSGMAAGAFFTVRRTWTKGDAVEIRFPMTIETSTWYNDSVVVNRGPLVYSLKIEEDWRALAGNDTRELKVPVHGGLLNREVYPKSPWNYGLIVDEDHPENFFTVEKKELADQPYAAGSAPVVLKAKGQLLPDWTLDGNLVGSLSYGRKPYDPALVRDIELIPFGCARLRITQFPKIGAPQDTVKTDKIEAYTIGGNKVQEINNVVVPPAADYGLKIGYTGSGPLSLVLNGKRIRDIEFAGDGALTLPSLYPLISEEHFRFAAGHYNNIRFIGNSGVAVRSVEVIPADRIKAIEITGITAGDGCFTVHTNWNRDISPYGLAYGTEPGNPTHTAFGFKGDVAVVTGLTPGTYYFTVTADVNGVRASTPERTVTVAAGLVRREDTFAISGVRAYGLIQITYPKIDGAASFKVEYGTEPGVYKNAVYDVIFNSYKHSECFTKDKTAIGGLRNDAAYYIRMTALKDNREISRSEELVMEAVSF